MNIISFLDSFIAQIELLEEGDTILETTDFRNAKWWDSMAALMIISMIDDEYGVAISGDDIRTCSSIKDLYKIVEGRLND